MGDAVGAVDEPSRLCLVAKVRDDEAAIPVVAPVGRRDAPARLTKGSRHMAPEKPGGTRYNHMFHVASAVPERVEVKTKTYP